MTYGPAHRSNRPYVSTPRHPGVLPTPASPVPASLTPRNPTTSPAHQNPPASFGATGIPAISHWHTACSLTDTGSKPAVLSRHVHACNMTGSLHPCSVCSQNARNVQDTDTAGSSSSLTLHAQRHPLSPPKNACHERECRLQQVCGSAGHAGSPRHNRYG